VIGVAPAGFRFRRTPHRLDHQRHSLDVAPAVRKSQWTLAAGRLKPGQDLRGSDRGSGGDREADGGRLPGSESGLDLLRGAAAGRDGWRREEGTAVVARCSRCGAADRLHQRRQPAAGAIPVAATRNGGSPHPGRRAGQAGYATHDGKPGAVTCRGSGGNRRRAFRRTRPRHAGARVAERARARRRRYQRPSPSLYAAGGGAHRAGVRCDRGAHDADVERGRDSW
jgi:hypothetical protein